MNEASIIRVLDYFGIAYRTYGKNISIGVVGVCCPYCEDSNFHLGIFKESGIFSCWKCTTKGDFFSLLYTINRISRDEVEQILLLGGLERSIEKNGEKQKQKIVRPKLPDDLIPLNKDFFVECQYALIKQLIKRFLSRRNYTIEDCFFWLSSVCMEEPYNNRLILPIFNTKKFVSFQAYDLTGTNSPKYKNFPGFSIKNYFYGIDQLKNTKRIILVEGVFDVWRLRGEAIGTFGVNLSKIQKAQIVELLSSCGYVELVMAFDNDAYDLASNIGRYFSPFAKVKVLRFPKGEDPDSFGVDRTLQLIDDTRCSN